MVRLLSETIISERSLFDRLKYLQRTLDELDIEGIYKLYQQQKSHLSDPTIEEWKFVVEKYKQRIIDHHSFYNNVQHCCHNCSNCHSHHNHHDRHFGNYNDYRDYNDKSKGASLHLYVRNMYTSLSVLNVLWY